MLSSLLTQFRQQYPQGSLTSDLLTIHDGQYVVRVCAGVDSRILASGLGANPALELAEDMATTRALERLSLAAAESPRLSQSLNHAPLQEPEVAIPEPQRALPSLEPSAILPRRGFANDPSEQPSDESIEPTRPKLTPPPLTLVPPHLDPEQALEVAAPDQSTVAVATPPLPQVFTPSQEELPDSFEAPANEFTEMGIEPAAIDLSDIIAQTDVELQRLGWGVTQGREFLEKTYGKRSRHDLTDDELLEFLLFLETQSPVPQP
ncbi:hypothetical protein VB780_15960 [Leptolyngbya sp. CCNP1308]|uniref:hypothetical protein n=1 Tax=Leptolyngbya sp. CCNP1308 TaxID=3110255 RepID=UPI002B2157D4|nr:hypothetical protein [Leptolyngbya sp. CCNP1308]MEA5450076.1 hypothetical protein [Leptolyngbya sp. CCNP1308]